MKTIEPKLLVANLVETLKTEWSTKIGSGKPISGQKFIFEVIDHNYSSNNRWHVWVQVPDRRFREQGIAISLDKDQCPDRASVRKNLIWRKSVVFEPTTIGNHPDYFYAKVFESSGPTGKAIRKRGQRGLMFLWLQTSYFRSKMRLKGTITTSKSHDLEQQVLLAKHDDYKRMIRTFFALRVWASL